MGPRFFRLRDALVDDSRDVGGGEYAAIFRGNEKASGLCHPVEGRCTAGCHGLICAIDRARPETSHQVEQGLHAQRASLRSKTLERDAAQIDPCRGIDLDDLLLQRQARQIPCAGNDRLRCSSDIWPGDVADRARYKKRFEHDQFRFEHQRRVDPLLLGLRCDRHEALLKAREPKRAGKECADAGDQFIGVGPVHR